jgi:trk system potassium uptake protein TrkH
LTTDKARLLQQAFYSRFWTPEKLLVGSFAGMILLTTLMLMLPLSAGKHGVGFVDALFTATSATCVTGLSVIDTATGFSRAGQIFILIAIQLGGIGIMTFSTFLLYIFGRSLSVRDSELLSSSFGKTAGTSARGLLWTVLVISIIIEAIGALFFYPEFATTMSGQEAVFSAIFHSVSAFCNAGFSLFPDSFSRYYDNPVVNLTGMLLIFLGGIGFIAFLELFQFIKSRIVMLLERLRLRKRRTFVTTAPFRFSLHTKLVVTTSLILIFAGALVIGVLEYQNLDKGMSLSGRILSSLFQSVTARTAGFNTINTGLMSGATLFVIMILMFIGASPGSCGGGIKVSTFAVLMGIVRARLTKGLHVVFFKRRVSTFVQTEAVTFVILASLVVVTGALLLQISETAGLSRLATQGRFLELLFEAVSAFGTVGLSTGITPELSPLSKLILIALMFIGRVGPLTLALAVARKKSRSKLTHPEGRVVIG